MFNLAEQFIVDSAFIAKANGGSSFDIEELARQFDKAPVARGVEWRSSGNDK